MANKNFEIAVVISAIDKFNRGLDEATTKAITKLQTFQKKADAITKSAYDLGRNSGAIGLASAAALAIPVKKFMEFEDSGLRLKSTMMEAGGVVNNQFEKVNALAVQLGSELKGNTSDFQDMFDAALSGGINAKTLLEGVGRSAAYMGNVLNINYNTAAAFSSKIKEATGVQNNEMMGMLDTLTKITKVMPGGDNSAKATELEEAFSRSSGQLKNLGLQGLETSKQVATVYAELIRSGAHGETVGTGFAKILESFYDSSKMAKFNSAASQVGLQFDFIDKKTGQFKGIENMVNQFDKMKGLNPQQRSNLISSLLGDGQDANFVKVFANLGSEGYNAMMNSINKQATLQERVKTITSSLSYQWEAAMGNMENAMADFGATLKPVLIPLIDTFNKLIGAISTFVKQHPHITQFIGVAIGGFSALMLTVSALAFTVGGFAKTFSILADFGLWFGEVVMPLINGALATMGGILEGIGAALMANPILAIIGAIAIAAFLIYKNWAGVKAFFTDLWDAISGAFKNAWDTIKDIMSGIWDFISSIGSKMYEGGKNIVMSIAKGIRDAATLPIRAIIDLVQKIRDYFPFSPAKRGALKDIHKVKLMETIAASIKADPLIKSVDNAVNTFARKAGGNIPTGAGANGGIGGITIHYNPVIQGVDGKNKSDIEQLLKQQADNLLQLLDERMRVQQRTALS